MKLQFLGCVFILVLNYFVNSQVVSNIRLHDHASYLINVVGETMREVEKREWCNLRMPEMSYDVNETIFGWEATGIVTYKNGFLKSVQNMDIIQSTVQQVWLYDRVQNKTTTDVRGTMRWHDLTLAYDVEAQINGETHHYSSVFTHPLVQFAFSILRDVFTDELTVSVTLSSLPVLRDIRMRLMPDNKISQMLSSIFVNNDTYIGIHDWAVQVFTPIARDVVMHKIEYPTICYDCNV